MQGKQNRVSRGIAGCFDLLYTGKEFTKLKRNRIILAFLILILQAIPYLLAATRWQPEWVFGGFLLNPIDGNTYLAKMQEGWSGGWRYTDLYTAQNSQGAALFLFYVALGHLARLLNLSLLVVFHAARILAGLGLLAVLSKFCDQIFGNDARGADLAFTLASLGSGLGWLAALGWGSLSGDFWIAEAYPFLSMYANPHFPLGLALLLGLVSLDLGPAVRWKGPGMAILGLLLSSIQPFGFALAGFLLAAGLVGRFWLNRTFRPGNLLWAMSLGGIFLLYQVWAIQQDPVLSAWNRQNLTPAPPLGDFLLALSPAFLLAFVGCFWAWKRRELTWFMIAAWLVGCSLLVYFPFNLQRRFMTGLYVPAVLLGVAGLVWMEGRWPKARAWMAPVLLILSLLTNLLVLASGVAGGMASKTGLPNPEIFLSQAEVVAMGWLKTNTPQGAVLLAPVRNGLLIPAWSGRRVVYGHPFETADAEQTKKMVEAFFSGSSSKTEQDDLLRIQSVSYIYFPAQTGANRLQNWKDLGTIVYNQEGITILKVKP